MWNRANSYLQTLVARQSTESVHYLTLSQIHLRKEPSSDRVKWNDLRLFNTSQHLRIESACRKDLPHISDYPANLRIYELRFQTHTHMSLQKGCLVACALLNILENIPDLWVVNVDMALFAQNIRLWFQCRTFDLKKADFLELHDHFYNQPDLQELRCRLAILNQTPFMCGLTCDLPKISCLSWSLSAPNKLTNLSLVW